MPTPIWLVEGVAIGSSTSPVADSLGFYIRALYNANYQQGYVYPSLAAGATVLSGLTNWTYGDYAEIIPAGTIGVAYHVSSVIIESCDVNGVFQLALYTGAGDTLVSTVRFAIVGGFWGNSVYLIPSVTAAASARLRAKLASSDGLANQATMTISIIYRLLP